MAAINTAVQNSNSVQRNEGLALLAPAQSNTTRLEQLIALAQNPAEKPLARGQALAEIDGITGGRRATLQLLDGGAPQIASARTESSVLALNSRTFGGDLWSRKVEGIQRQLAQEAQLNAAGNPQYSQALANMSNRIANGSANLPDGTYTRVNTPEWVTTNRDNPLRIDTISAQNSRLTIQGLDNRIAANSAEIARLEQVNTTLRQRLEGNFNPIDQGRFRAEMANNGARILRLQGDNAVAGLERNKAVNDARLQGDQFENGKMYRAVADQAVPSRPPVIFINGVNTDTNRSALQAMELSAQFRAPVDHVVNVSSMDKLLSGGLNIIADRGRLGRFDNNVSDQQIQQHLTGNPPAAQTAANAILDQLDNSTGKVKIVGYSQGAAIGSEALRMVESALEARGLNLDQRKAILSRIEFLGIGPAAATRHVARTYVGEDQGGPRLAGIPALGAIDYRTISDANDPISRALNISDPNGGATTGNDLGRTVQGLRQLASPGGVLPHLSYFRTYMATDPGSIYNPQMSNALHQWYAGAETPRNTIIRGANTGQ